MEIDISDVNTREGLHSLLAAKLGFPSYYGGNWDAFWDCIRDPEQSKMPKELVIHGAFCARQVLPLEIEKLNRCLRDLVHDRPEIRVHWS